MCLVIPNKSASCPYVLIIIGQRCPKLNCILFQTQSRTQQRKAKIRTRGVIERKSWFWGWVSRYMGRGYRTGRIWHYGAGFLSITVQYYYVILAFRWAVPPISNRLDASYSADGLYADDLMECQDNRPNTNEYMGKGCKGHPVMQKFRVCLQPSR